MRKLLLGLLLVATPLSALNAMNVRVFLEKADALQRRGIGALFSADYRLLKREVEANMQALRAERLAAERAGRRGAYCPPAKPSLDSNEILSAFRTIPEAQRERIEVKDALRALMARKYPCR
jgi:hypothetical protein